jgi:hypothetical protein
MIVIPIMLVFIGAAVAFGVVHDQVTARVCVEYFTIGHERIVATDSPLVLGLIWGVVATWWAGALAGVVVALAAREGPWPRLTWRHFVRPAAALSVAMAIAALGAGVLGYALTASGRIGIVPSYADAIVPGRQARFMADVFAHATSYGVGLLGAIAIAVQSLAIRRGLARPARAA